MNSNSASSQTFLARFFKMESAGGIVLIIATVVAMIVANSPLRSLYAQFIDLPFVVGLGSFQLAKPLFLWINDGLMAIFFLLVGLELKREMVEGELSEPSSIVLPALAAIGGMAAPALIYIYFNYGDPVAMQGWAIPAATDIAFALGILSLLGSRVPVALKVFLTSIAIFDDLGAILIIAFFYTSKISMVALLIVFLTLPVLYILNKRGVDSKSIYFFVGAIMWVAMIKSGVHATLSGVILAMFIPIKSKKQPDHSPLKELEHDLHELVAFVILPIFAFANAGINFENMKADQIFNSVPVGVAMGLLFGKIIGVFGFSGLAIKTKLAKMPNGMDWMSLFGTAALCGVGFTMSLFIGSLAFEDTGVNLLFDERIGIIAGSLIAGIFGYFILKFSLKPNASI